MLVDPIDMDIEGQEPPAVTSTIAELDAQVNRLHIGTHGTEIESGLREIPWGPIRFENGVQSWVNPRLAH